MHTMALRLVSTLAVLVALYALVAYAGWPVGTVLHPEVRASFAAQPAGVLYAHVFGAAVTLLVGPLQFWRRLRRNRPQWHRWLGRVYLVPGVLVGGASGAVLAVQAFGGIGARAGFLLLALAWMATGAMAWSKIRQGDIDAHRRWMIRNFGLSLAAVSLRLWLPALAAAGVPMAVAYPLAAWLCWVPQVVAIEWHFARRGGSMAWRRWTAGALALLGGCAGVQPARLDLPHDFATGVERVELQGLGAGTRGQAPVLGRTLWFDRSASRLSLFDDLARIDRSALQWRWSGSDTAQADCRSRRRTHTAGIIEIVGRPLEIACRFEPSGDRLTIWETGSATRSLKQERRGELQLGDVRWTVRSLHRAQGAAFDVAQPLGYVIEDGGRAVAAVELRGTRPVLHLPPADDPRRARSLPALLSLALLWDESGS